MKNYQNKLLSGDTPFAVMESYRSLRANMMYLGVETEHPVYAVTGYTPDVGKTLTCLNLAISYAQIGKKTVVVDLDLRNPSQNEALGMKNGDGVSEFLAGITDTPSVQATAYENLYTISAGRRPPDPTAFLMGARFPELIRKLRETYDVIFLDLPPTGVVSDGYLVAPHVDGYLLVIGAGQSNAKQIRSMTNGVERAKGTVLGFVLNGVSPKNSSYGRVYRYYGK